MLARGSKTKLANQLVRGYIDRSTMKWGYRLILVLTVIALTALVWSGIGWGLPSRHANHYLFAPNPLWTGAELARFDQSTNDESIGADVDFNPLDHSQEKIILNDSDEKRAEIVRRYRLYSNQPDEMITYRALQRMNPGALKLDPHLYQYGGLWIYGTGAFLKIASLLNFVTITSDKTFYYDHPEEFGKFYIVARFYTLICYVLLLVVVGLIAKRLFHLPGAIFSTVLLTGVSPVVFAMAHEAKPHLPGAMLMCLSCLMGMRYIDRGKRTDAILAGVACGLSIGMVLSAVVIIVVLPLMILLRKQDKKSRMQHLALSGTSALIVYFATNPYVMINLFVDRQALISNLGNTSAMYHVGSINGMFLSTFQHLQNASTTILILLAFLGLQGFVFKRHLPPKWWVLLVPTFLILIQFFLFSENKPAEYARFAIFPVIMFVLLVVANLNYDSNRWTHFLWGIGIAGFMLYNSTWAYIEAFDTDSTPIGSSRMVAAANIDSLRSQNGVLQLAAEPAPYSAPPVGLWGWQVVLTSPEAALFGDVCVRTIDDPTLLPMVPGYTARVFDTGQSPAPITWANKPVVIWIKDSK